MNVHRLRHASPILLTAVLALSGCVMSGQLDDGATESASETSGGESDGSAMTSAGSAGGSGALESGSSFGEGGGACADYTPPPLDCEPAGPVTANVGYSNAVLEVLDDTECTVARIRDRGEAGLGVDFDCPTGPATLHVTAGSPEFALPFVEGESILLTIRSQATSSMVRTLGGDLLLAYVQVNGFEPDVDLGTIEIGPGLSWCPPEPVPVASCSAGGSVAFQHTSLKVASDGSASVSVSEGHSAMIESDGRSFLFIVGYALKTVCWDEGCSIDQMYVDLDGGMGFLLVAQSG